MTIKEKQRFLKEQGFYTGNIDGDWGKLSKEATALFQKSQHIEVDGKFGPVTTKCATCINDGGYKTKESFKVGDIKFTYIKKDGQVYNVYIDENSLLSKNFRLKEFMMHKDTCKKAGISDTERKKVILYEQLIIACQKLREVFGQCKVNSGYRNAKYNKYIGGSKNSAHTEGKAADLSFKNAKPKEVQAYVRKHYKELGVYGLESKTKPNCNQYTHIDIKKRNGNKLVEF
jgi:uncharacterized protein YcbK (DUF882 family)